MSSPPLFTFQQLASEIIANLARAISERHGESPQQKLDRFRVVTQMVLAFLPRDVIEITLGCRVILFHELTLNAAQDLLRGQTDPMRRSTRGNIVALDRCFHANLAKLEHYQTRRSDGMREEAEDQHPDNEQQQPPNPAKPPSNQPIRTVPAAAARRNASGPATLVPPRAVIEALERNDAALAALAVRDPIAFAKAMGIENPSLDLGTAAAQWAELFESMADQDQPAPEESMAAE